MARAGEQRKQSDSTNVCAGAELPPVSAAKSGPKDPKQNQTLPPERALNLQPQTPDPNRTQTSHRRTPSPSLAQVLAEPDTAQAHVIDPPLELETAQIRSRASPNLRPQKAPPLLRLKTLSVILLSQSER
ncbi:hypothetical protein WMY93_030060 [Mugilogobius chulae]|uniref:Uncharacterized protein n=1 Tax=Mugilogobius chulae TaxID=88201 RepID=A0AAW0MSY6_9GOBI